MAFNEELAERIRQGLAQCKGIEEKKMFSGIGFLLNGNLLVGVRQDSLLVRLGPEQAEKALPEPHVKEFDITGRSICSTRSASCSLATTWIGTEI